MKRLEFKKKVRLEIWLRAGGPERLKCEACAMPLMGKRFEVDHILECWEVPYRDDLKAEDGKLLCIPCHDTKTGKKAGERAHGNRIIKKAAGIKRRSSFKTNRDGPYRMKLDGSIERRS